MKKERAILTLIEKAGKENDWETTAGFMVLYMDQLNWERKAFLKGYAYGALAGAVFTGLYVSWLITQENDREKSM